MSALTTFFLSHHPPDEFDRCYRIGLTPICARCLGTYPVMFAALAAQFVFAFPLQHRLDIPLGVVFILPAVIDWALGRFQPHRFSNPWRTFTGALLGLGLARSLFIHVQQPFPRVLVVQGALVSVIVLPVLFVTYRLHRTE